MNRGLKTYILFFLLFSFVKINAQVSKADSLSILDRTFKAQDFLQTNVDSALSYAESAYKLALETKSVFLQCRTTLLMGVVSQNLSDYKKATAYFKQGVTMSEKMADKDLQSQAYTGFANMFAIQNQYDQATEYFNRSLKLAKELKDYRKIAVISMNLANIEYYSAYKTKDFSKSNKAFAEAYEWAVLSKDTDQIISCLGNWGLSFCDEKKFELSLEKLNEAVKLAIATDNKSELISLNYFLGRTYGEKKEYQKATYSYSESLKWATEFKDIDYISENYGGLASVSYDMGNYKEAYDYFLKFKIINDTILTKETTNELNAIKVKYDTEKKQKQIEILEVSANKDKVVKISLLVGAILLLVLAFLMFNRYRLKEKTNQLLETQNQIISEKNKDISDSINYAKKIQDAILPSSDDIHKVFPESFVLSLPKDVVSGDFYWFTQHQHLKIFVVADCTGHGVPGALMSMIGNTLLNSIVNERRILVPNIILNELRKEIISVLKQGEGSSNKDGMDISLVCFNTQTNTLEAACANNPVWIIKNNGEFVTLKPDKQPIGYASANQKDFSLQTIVLEKGDSIYQFTDGYADQFGGAKGKKLKYNQLKEILIANKNMPLEKQSETLKKMFIEWKGNLEQIDDVLVTGIRV